jgi:hypothetical protein
MPDDLCDCKQTAPPIGFRKAIPTRVKLDVVIRQSGLCKTCGSKLGTLDETEFDHVPALQLRLWDTEAEDTLPKANDPEHIEAKHRDCHAQKTSGRKGESKLSAVGGDTRTIAKVRRLAKAHDEFRRRVLSAEREPEQEPPKRKYRWPKRPFPKRPKGARNGSTVSGRSESS